MFEYICFASQIPFFLACLAIELLVNIVDFALGFNRSRLQAIAIMQYKWKDLRGIKPVDTERVYREGYYYQKIVFSDGKYLLIR